MRDAALKSLAVGFFDGVHLGHQAILKGADAALTFRNHPLTVLAPEKAPRLIMSVEERVAAIKACGVKDVEALDFTREFAEMSAEKFAEEYFLAAKGRKEAQRIICGENWRLGKGGEGSAEFLRGMGIDVTVVPYAEHRGERVSSSRIRRSLENGEIEDANAMLGRRYEVRGMREEGKGLGRELGFPTVNFHLVDVRLNLLHGVYEVITEGLHGVANYGLAPTMGDQAWRQPVLEVHFPSAHPSSLIPHPSSLISFVRFIRPEKKFETIDDLKRQIAADCATITT